MGERSILVVHWTGVECTKNCSLLVRKVPCRRKEKEKQAVSLQSPVWRLITERRSALLREAGLDFALLFEAFAFPSFW